MDPRSSHIPHRRSGQSTGSTLRPRSLRQVSTRDLPQATKERTGSPQSCAAEAEGKLCAITSVLIPRVRYPGQLMPWTEEQIDSLDALVRSATRQILNKDCSYTNFVLHHWIVCSTLWRQSKRRNTKRSGEHRPEEDSKQQQ